MVVPEPAQPKTTVRKTCQSKITVEDIITDDVQAPPPAQERPVLGRKPAAPATAAPGTNAEDESFVPARALKRVLPVAGAEAPPSQPAPAQPVPPLSKPAPRGPSPSRSSPDDNETPPPPSTQPHRPLPPPSESPHTPSPPIVRDPGFTPSPLDFETTSAEEQLHISRLCPTKRPISQEELDAEDDLAFHKEIVTELEAKAKTKTKKGKGKARDVNGPFKSGPIPDEVKEHLYAIHADFERQVEELAVEIGKLPHLLFSLVGETPLPTRCATTPWGANQAWYGVHREREKPSDMLKEEWTKIVSFEYNKYCDDNLGPLSKDPEARAELLKPMLEWYAAKYGMYAEEKKVDGSFNKVIMKAQQDFVHLAKLNHKYNGLHCFGFIINLQPNHTNRTFSSMWGATPAFEQMKVTEKGVISRQIADWEGMLRVAQLQLNAKDNEDTESRDKVEKQLWSVLDPGNLLGRDANCKTFLAWLGNDIGRIKHGCGEPLEKCRKIMMPWASWPDYACKHHMCLVNWPCKARAPDGLKKGGKPYDYKEASNGLLQANINASNWKRGDDYLHDRAIQIISWGDDEMELDIEDPELLTLPLIMNVDDQTIVCVNHLPKFNHNLAEAKGLPSVRNNMSIPKALRRTLRVDPGGIFGTNEDHIGSKSRKAQADRDKCCRSEDNKPGPSRKKSCEDDADDQDIHTIQMSGAMQQQLMKFLALFEG
ncbi:hypothetical protein DXG01_015875 [Tephrocybe rancida]|nr:hypothetical protein DXG01_015875 [Tephrocybe rancida]